MSGRVQNVGYRVGQKRDSVPDYFWILHFLYAALRFQYPFLFGYPFLALDPEQRQRLNPGAGRCSSCGPAGAQAHVNCH